MYITFAGGAASGKSSTIRQLQKRVKADYQNRVLFLPEAFGILFQGMPDSLSGQILSPDRRVLRQYIIDKLEVQMVKDIFAAQPDAIVISDRGFWDIEAYCSAEETDLIVRHIGENNIPVHDFCVYFESTDSIADNIAADADTLRIEADLEETKKLAAVTRDAWITHTSAEKFLSIPPYPTSEDKGKAVAALLNEKIGLPIFDV